MITANEPAPSVSPSEPEPPALTYRAVFVRFLRFGLAAFGGPVAQIAMIRRELVDEEKWIGSGRFNRLLAVFQVLPGPEAHELCVHLGIRAKGRIGGILAGLGFMLPGFVLMIGLAWIYTRLRLDGTVLGAMFLGVQAAVLAIVLRAVQRIGRHILVDRWLWAIAAGVAVTSLIGLSFWIALPAAGITYVLASSRRTVMVGIVAGLCAVAAADAWLARSEPMATVMAMASVPSAAMLFWTGLKGGLLTFGGAYTAIPFVRNDSVNRGWMTDAQFLDGLALSGVLPAPLVIFATFVGWVAGGPMGAIAITAGMFLPAFAFSLLFYERLEALAEHRRLQTFLAGVAAAVVGLIAVTIVDLARTAVERTPSPLASTVLFLLALAFLVGSARKSSAAIVLALSAMAGAIALR